MKKMIDPMTVLGNDNPEMKNKLVKQYEPLMNKIISQFTSRMNIRRDDVMSMAQEGLAIAMNTYDSTRSSMTFTQFAAFAIRNNILTSIDNELRTVKMSNYAQKKAAESGESLFNSISIDKMIHPDDSECARQVEVALNMFENENFSDGDIFEYLYTRISAKFNKRDSSIFYMTFGLNGYEEEKGKDIATKLGISKGLVSQRLKAVIDFIRNDDNLREVMGRLL